MNKRNPAAHALAEKVSKRMGVTLTDAVIHSLEAQLHTAPRPIDPKKIAAIQKEIASLRVLDTRTDDEILGYDEFGIPR
jgi:antitoxin VapB